MYDKKLKILIIGDSGVGKTALIRQFSERRFNLEETATIGVDYSKKTVLVNKTHVSVRLWDTAGQERFRSLGIAFYRASEGCALVFDVTNLGSFHSLRYWLNVYLEANPPSPGKSLPIIVIGNKTDLNQKSRAITSQQAKKWCQQNGCLPYFELSAKDYKKTEEAFMALTFLALQSKETLKRFPNPLRLIPPPPETYDCSCSLL